MTAFEAPSNIALIKYMGKLECEKKNTPANASISLTLPKLLSRVELEEDFQDNWTPLNQDQWELKELSENGQNNFILHFQNLKNKFGITKNYKIKSGNNFPSDCGIASSASSFAALTGATYKLASEQNMTLDLSAAQLGEISQAGSGSSARSFIAPICEWNANGISEFKDCAFELEHQILIVRDAKKLVSSREAHQRIRTSLLYPGRINRAEDRLGLLKNEMKSGNWAACHHIIWEEFWDMHGLFHTSTPAFHYMTGATVDALDAISNYWSENSDGPWVTLDAGANVHLIYRKDQKSIKLEMQKLFSDYQILDGV